MNHIDSKSLGLCMSSIFLKFAADITLSDAATALAGLAALTTVAYNVQQMYRHRNDNKKK
jgi:uncharacterized membrane protein YebE (DUF533 family)